MSTLPPSGAYPLDVAANLASVRTTAAARDRFDIAAIAVIALVCAAAALSVGHYAISNDEPVQHRYGELIVSYYASGFADRSLFAFQNLYLYGGLFDIVAVLLAKLLPFDAYLIRHALCAAIGVAGLIATWASARLVGGSRAGFIAALALATTAQWFGVMFNHTKDIPFAAAMMGALYFLLRLARALPQPRWGDVLGFGLMLAAAWGMRAMGLLLLIYLGAVVLYCGAPALAAGWRDALRFAGRATLRLLPGVALGYAIMLVLWPWAALAPLNPIWGLIDFSHFHYHIRTIFAGQIYEMGEVPRWYIPAYLAIRLPLPLLAGAALTLPLLLSRRLLASAVVEPARARREVATLWLAAAFPVLCQVALDGPAFTGMRHFLFVVPPLAALAGLGFDAALNWIKGRGRMLAAALLAAAFVWEASLMVRLHPYEYLYYNRLVGGLPGAQGRYVMDYWVNIMPEAVRRLEAYLDHDKRTVPGRRYTVGICAERPGFENVASPRLQWTDGWQEADFFIAPTHMGCDASTSGKVVVRIERLGVLIGVVKDRRGYR